MSINVYDESSVLLRLEFYATRAVHQRGLGAVLRVVATAWWNRPRIPADLSPRLRADMGLPVDTSRRHWPEQVPLILWRPGL